MKICHPCMFLIAKKVVKKVVERTQTTGIDDLHTYKDFAKPKSVP